MALTDLMELSTMLAVGLGGFALFQISRMVVGKVAPARARELVAGGARLVDVRTPEEHAAGHIEGSSNLPVHELASRLEELGDKSAPIVLYCASGMRSARAAGTLRRAGFTEVHDLGAMARWR